MPNMLFFCRLASDKTWRHYAPARTSTQVTLLSLQSLWVLFRSRSCRAWQICSRPGRHGETRSSTTTCAQKTADGCHCATLELLPPPRGAVRESRGSWCVACGRDDPCRTRRNKLLQFRSRSLLRFCCSLQNTATQVAPVEQFVVPPALVFTRAGALLHEMLRRPMLDCVSIVEAAVSPRLEGLQFHTDMVLF